MKVALVVIAAFVGVSLAEEVLKVSARDSYLDAYRETHSDLVKKKENAENNNDRTYNVDQQYPVYSGPSGPSGGDQYGPPTGQYRPPVPQYGPPTPQYGPPAPQYGPPGPPPEPQYGPPGPVYGGPQSVQVFYGMPHAMLSLWDKLKWKLDLFTIGKILLKLVIFKKIVSLIAILCLLLFIPALKKKGSSLLGDDGGDERSLSNMTVTGEAKLNNIANFVDEAIQMYSKRESHLPQYCDSTYCKAEKVLKRLNKKMSYKKLMKLYSKEMISASK